MGYFSVTPLVLWTDLVGNRMKSPAPLRTVTATATAITATRFSPQRITIVNSIWIVAKLDGTVNYVRMTASPRARICRVDPFERIAIDWFHISFSSFCPNHVRCKENKLIKYCRYGFISPCLPFAFIACFSFGLVADTQSWYFLRTVASDGINKGPAISAVVVLDV